jgi:hypothetical protein
VYCVFGWCGEINKLNETKLKIDNFHYIGWRCLRALAQLVKVLCAPSAKRCAFERPSEQNDRRPIHAPLWPSSWRASPWWSLQSQSTIHFSVRRPSWCTDSDIARRALSLLYESKDQWHNLPSIKLVVLIGASSLFASFYTWRPLYNVSNFDLSSYFTITGNTSRHRFVQNNLLANECDGLLLNKCIA